MLISSLHRRAPELPNEGMLRTMAALRIIEELPAWRYSIEAEEYLWIDVCWVAFP